MRAAILSTVLLASCNQWVRPTPDGPHTRNQAEQHLATVRVESLCDSDSFDDNSIRVSHVGTGVMVSDWQVLTALHVVECTWAIARIRVTTTEGSWSFSPEKEWKGLDVARIQMSSADTMRPRLPTPTVRLRHIDADELVYIQSASPRRVQILGEAAGWEYIKKTGRTFIYSANTEEGNSGAGIYDSDGALIGIHLGTDNGGDRHGARVSQEMIPQ